jgi:hypothetical protein
MLFTAVPLRQKFFLVVLLHLIVSAAASSQVVEPARRQLIVLLAAGPQAPTPEALVAGFQAGERLPGQLGTGSPEKVEFLIRVRAQGVVLERMQARPESPWTRLQRYVVLTYPEEARLGEIAAALRGDPAVLHVEENAEGHLSIEPSDPLFCPPGATSPFQRQWGSSLLKFAPCPSSDSAGLLAWDVTPGHGYVGVVDTGIAVDHPDFRAFSTSGSMTSYTGGNFRPHLSRDYGYQDNNVDENQSQGVNVTSAGHGTHVAGIIGATANNGQGVAGTCWHCSLVITKASRLDRDGKNSAIFLSPAAEAIEGSLTQGAQAINLSLGFRSPTGTLACGVSPNPDENLGAFCDALAVAQSRDVIMVAASGNCGVGTIDFPARDPRVIAAGGIVETGSFWDTCSTATDSQSCEKCRDVPGSLSFTSNYGPEQTLVAPARAVQSTFYPGKTYSSRCQDADGDGYATCTGTSMATPYVTAAAALVRSVNPLLTAGNVRQLLTGTATNGGAHDDVTGFGTPDVAAAAYGALGRAAGVPLANRLTPLLSLYSSQAQDHLYTTVPQMALAAMNELGTTVTYLPVGPGVSHYEFPDCYVSGCPTRPSASLYLFTTPRPPFTGAPPLVPLYRMTYRGATSSNPLNRDTTYTTEPAGIVAFKDLGYELDGREGYLYKRCSPEPGCIPPGAEKVYRYYHPGRADWAVFPESELAQMMAAGYQQPGWWQPVIGYAYPNVDSDGDLAVDGFELLAGTNPAAMDSDCDGAGDGQELLAFGPGGYGDPRQGPCSSGAPRAAQLLSQTVPASMVAGQTYPVSLTLRNVGTMTWSPIGAQCGAFRLGSASPYNNTTWGSTRAELPASVAPGGQVTFNFSVTAPAAPGTYTFQWQMVQECVTWFGQVPPGVAVSVAAARDARIVSQSVPAVMIAGLSYPVSLRIRNTGALSWSPVVPGCGAYRLGSVHPNDNVTWGASRTELPAPVAPGGEVVLNFTVTAPSAPGTYNFQRRMVQECVAWFGDASPNVAVSVSP